MWQVLFVVPGLGIKIFGYGLMLFLAFLASMNLAAWRARREKLDPEVIYDLALWLFLGGLVGARAFYVIQYWGTRVRSFGEIFRIWEGGIVLYGSLIGGALAFLLYRAFRPFPVRPVMDAIAPSLAVGIALGRIGCFLNGCCWGDACDLPWAVQFPANSPPWNAQLERGLIAMTSLKSLPLHPTQLYSAFDGLVILGLLSAYYPLRRRDGEVFALFVVTYPITRFLVEHLRNDESAMYFGMTVSQLVSVGLLAAGALYWAFLQRLPATRYADDPEAWRNPPALRESQAVSMP